MTHRPHSRACVTFIMLPEAIMPKWSIRRPLSELAAEEATEEATAVAAAAAPSTHHGGRRVHGAGALTARGRANVLCVSTSRARTPFAARICAYARAARSCCWPRTNGAAPHARGTGADNPLCRTNSRRQERASHIRVGNYYKYTRVLTAFRRSLLITHFLDEACWLHPLERSLRNLR